MTTENHLNPSEKRWFAVYTKYKREKVVFKLLQEKKIEVYLPLQQITRQWERKRRVVELPLISCYIFVKITKPEYTEVLDTEHVVNFVKFSKNLISIPDGEIKLMQRVLGEGVEVQLEKVPLSKGDFVEIMVGNLAGVKGRLVEEKGKSEVVVELESLGYGMRIAIDPSFLEKRSAYLGGH